MWILLVRMNLNPDVMIVISNDTPQEQIVVRRRLEVVKEELLNLCLQIQCLVYQSLQMKMKHHLHIYLRLIVLI